MHVAVLLAYTESINYRLTPQCAEDISANCRNNPVGIAPPLIHNQTNTAVASSIHLVSYTI